MANSPDIEVVVSVVIPTYNRVDLLRRVLEALATQTCTDKFEVIVVSDGSTDGTHEFLQSGEAALPIRFLMQQNAGPAAARNRGIEAAFGRIVLFVDDDVVPAPDLLERHLAAHSAQTSDVAVMGPMLNPEGFVMSSWIQWEQYQLYKQYEALNRGDYPPTFRQFFTGNASMPRDRLLQVGMFNATFRRSEDVELAYRLSESGLSFVFAADAKGFHHAERSFESWLRTAREYGRNDVEFMAAGQSWIPGAISAEFADRNRFLQILTRHVASRPRSSRIATTALSWLSLTRALRPLQRQVFSALYGMTYYRGFSETVGSRRAFLDLLDDGTVPIVPEPHRLEVS